MPYAILEDKISRVSLQYRKELMDFIDFLLFKQGHDVGAESRSGIKLGIAEGRFRIPTEAEDRQMDAEIVKMFQGAADEVSA